MNIKNILANELKIDGFSNQQIEAMLTTPPQNDMGDFCLPCFAFAKEMKKSPNQIAESLAQKFCGNKLFEKVEAQNAYLNLFLNKKHFSKLVLDNAFKNLDEFGKENLGNGKLACIEYSSINVAKNPHVGHLCCTIYGESFARLFESFGYKVKRLNYIGDYGTQFGKMINGFLTFGDKQKVLERGVDELQDIYIKANKMCEDDENFLKSCRQTFLKLEQGDEQIKKLYDWFVKLSLDEAKKFYDELEITFDDYRGEAFYAKFNTETLELLKQKNLLVRDEGALLVDLSAFNLGKAIVEQSSGASLYATRDLSALIKRHEFYNYDKFVYVTGSQQQLYFKQVFKIGELLGLDFMDKVCHTSYGMLSLPEGKISSRKGAVGLLKDFFKISIDKAKEVLTEKGTETKDFETLSKQIGIGALVFSILRTTSTKDAVFDINQAISFDGETGPYLQYTFARTNSIIEKFGDEIKNPNFELLPQNAFEIVKLVEKFPSVLKTAFLELEPSVIARFAIDLASSFNKFYNETKILCKDKQTSLSQVALTKIVQEVLKKCLFVLVMKAPEKM